ncbi:heat-inducible transcription repressor [Helicobacter aurati]|uniref:Heat-inducible transcription repressor n=1 Tax=Helicobacter aurati TaxID=137778 RepID=A0A3D8J161_9HELI|nr:heat-inducible transcription repressor [Helicobacter aurati]RDU71262.1 heat-inducible transcription repressor [Helicobacter aurati]
MSIKNKLLIGIIQEYIKSKEPIGSEFLKSQQNFNVSSATIRNYCKVLEKEGALFQPHTSSGRIPTHTSLSSYWKETLRSFIERELETTILQIADLSRRYEVFCITIPKESNVLENVVNVEQTYLILEFSRNETVIGFSERLSRFIKTLVGLDVQDIIKIASAVGARELKEKLLCLKQFDFNLTSYRYGSEFLRDIAFGNGEVFMDFYNAYALLKYQNGIYFNILPSGYLTIIHDICYLDQHNGQKNKARMLCAGSLLADYRSFYKELHTGN